jgi:hypothetical protein
MELRERTQEQPAGQRPDGPAPGGNLDGLRQAGHDYLAAGDAAIERALSGDSTKFLEANKQQGGE